MCLTLRNFLTFWLLLWFVEFVLYAEYYCQSFPFAFWLISTWLISATLLVFHQAIQRFLLKMTLILLIVSSSGDIYFYFNYPYEYFSTTDSTYAFFVIFNSLTIIISLHTFYLRQKTRKDLVNDRLMNDCPICQDSSGQDYLSLPCLHTFHSSCITKWISSHNTCPVCRITVI